MTFEALIALLEREQFELGAAYAPEALAYRRGWNQRAEALIRLLRAENTNAAPEGGVR